MKSLIRFASVFSQVITVAALTAHLLEMPVKMNLSMLDYKLVQSLYQGWAWLGIFEVGAIVCSVAWLILDRNKNRTKKLLIAASGLLVLSLLIFFSYTMPANNATQNWTVLPDDWTLQRQNWEYSHAIRAVLNLVGLSLQLFALLHLKKASYKRVMHAHIIPATANDF